MTKRRSRSTSSAGIISPDRLHYLPQRYWADHEFCFHLHDQILHLLREYESSGAHNFVRDAFAKALFELGRTDEPVDMLAALKGAGLLRPYKHYIVSHLVLGLTGDMLHFLYEALMCFERRKFSVGFALLRKPLKENLLFLSWLLADQDDFINRFEANNYTTLASVTAERRKEIMRGAIAKLFVPEAFDDETLESIIFSKKNPDGLEPVWQKATHLITSAGDLLKTEDLNVNFIFNDASSDHLFGLLYAKLPYALMYATQVAVECFAYILRYNQKTVTHLIVSTMGCYQTFTPGTQHVTRMLSKQLRPFLRCQHCSARMKLTRANARQMYLREQLTCYACEATSAFPFYWILGESKMSIERNNGVSAILGEHAPVSAVT